MHPIIAKRLISIGSPPARRSMAIVPKYKQQITEKTIIYTSNITLLTPTPLVRTHAQTHSNPIQTTASTLFTPQQHSNVHIPHPSKAIFLLSTRQYSYYQ